MSKKKKIAITDRGDVVSVSYAIAVKEARDLYGDDLTLNRPKDDGRSVGQVVSRTDFHLVQFIGKDAVVVHELAKLDRVPPIGRNVVIDYSAGRGSVVDRSQEKVRGGSFALISDGAGLGWSACS
ncbi:hypothetical protein ACFS07_36060 [Undibacterium arcticum]